MKAKLTILALAAAAYPFALAAAAHAGDVAVTGKLGFMGEWEVKANARDIASGRRAEFSGPLTLIHVGLCSVNGPVEKSGEIRLRRAGLIWSRIEATLNFDGKQCTFAARGTKTFDGTLQCPGGGIPLQLQIN
jgi:hypothetical protein